MFFFWAKAVFKNFLWKVGNNLLPTRKILNMKKIIDNPICLVCMLDEENTTHVLWVCPAATYVWGAGISPTNRWMTEDICF